MNLQAKWITADVPRDVAPAYVKKFAVAKPVRQATLRCTALGVYETFLGGRRVGDFVLAPGWTVYKKRLQVQSYDVTALLCAENTWTATVAPGWFSSPMGWIPADVQTYQPKAFLGELCIRYEDGTEEIIATDESWEAQESKIRFSEIYDGETYDASFNPADTMPVQVLEHPTDILIPQEGEQIVEHERVAAQRVFKTPAGETVVDFGQEVTGYVEFSVNAKQGDKIRILHGEVLDQKGSFYNANYRRAKAEINYTCKDGEQTYHPHLTFFGFRYIKLDQWPDAFETISPGQFTAIAVYSDIRRTGHVESSSPKLNQLFSNIFWGQRGNFLDIPTDCPQRDERLGWTGDAEVFIKAASYNFDVNKFFTKWLHDMTADQFTNGGIPHVIPNILTRGDSDNPADCSAAWADAACICPWQLYKTYGNKQILADQFETMKRWVGFIGAVTKEQYLWTGGTHFGDWLGLDSPVGSYKGSTRDDFVASAYYANSVQLVVKAGRVLGEDVSEYEALYEKIVETFRKTFSTYTTQTEHVLALHFGLAEDPLKTADALAAQIQKDGCMKTGFVGTPYLLHVLSDHGHGDLAYELLLREPYPSWLYPVNKGATTIWEHWDGIMENGDFWSTDMNSFNHYAYGSVIDWVYEKALGIRMPEDAAGFEKLRIEPVVTDQLTHLAGSIDTVNGKVSSAWTWVGENVRYEIELPVDGEIVIGGVTRTVKAGKYTLWN